VAGQGPAHAGVDRRPGDPKLCRPQVHHQKPRKNEHGRPLKIIPNLLVVAPANEGVARKILTAETNASGATNIWQGTAELLVAPELAGNDNMWFLLDVSKPIKPLFFQRRRAPQFVAKDQPDGENVFIKARRNSSAAWIAATMPDMACGNWPTAPPALRSKG